MQAASQIRLNREHKETCEMDWSDKVEAYNIDRPAGASTARARRCSPIRTPPPSRTGHEEGESRGAAEGASEEAVPGFTGGLGSLCGYGEEGRRRVVGGGHSEAGSLKGWASPGAPGSVRALQELKDARAWSRAPSIYSASPPLPWLPPPAAGPHPASANLRVLVDCILRDTSEDLRLQCDAVNLAFGRRCEQLEDARHKLQHHLNPWDSFRARPPLCPLITWPGPSTPPSSALLTLRDPRRDASLPQTYLKPDDIGYDRRVATPMTGQQELWGGWRQEEMLREVTDQEHNVALLKQAIKDKEAPLHVAQTQLYLHSHRPNMELCCDAGQFRCCLGLWGSPGWPSPAHTLQHPCLVSEVEELNMSLAALQEKPLEAEQSLRNLEDTRTSLEKDITSMTNSLFIDCQKCMAHRTHYPTVLQLAGYQ
ncbi:Tektin-4 [Plecturocebus cupreus]